MPETIEVLSEELTWYNNIYPTRHGNLATFTVQCGALVNGKSHKILIWLLGFTRK